MKLTIEIPNNTDLSQDIVLTIPRKKALFEDLFKEFDSKIDDIQRVACEKLDELKKQYDTKAEVKPKMLFSLGDFERLQNRQLAAMQGSGLSQCHLGGGALYRGQQAAFTNIFG